MIRFDANIKNYVFMSDRFNIHYNGQVKKWIVDGSAGKGSPVVGIGETIDRALNVAQDIAGVYRSQKAKTLIQQIERDRAVIVRDLLPISGAPGSAAHQELAARFAGRPGIAL